MDIIKPGKRITLKRTRPNPLFQSWLEELHEEAKQKKSKVESMLNEALVSLSKYPLPLQTGAECAILNGFDRKLCVLIDKKLEEYKNVHQTKSSSSIQIETNTINDTISPSTITRSNPLKVTHTSPIKTINLVKAKRPSENIYKPAYQSGAYALLIALLKHSNNNERLLNKNMLIEYAQKYCDDSFNTSKPGKLSSAWSEIDILIKIGLVNTKKCKTMMYSLTDEGITVANDLFQNLQESPVAYAPITNCTSLGSNEILPEKIHSFENDNCSINSNTSLLSCSTSTFEGIELEPNNFDIVLLIDKSESNGVKKKDDPTIPLSIHHEYRSLKVGDYTWVAKDKSDKNKELVLPYIVERKRMDDFAASIKDGRFHEQKFRLRRSGIENIIYLVENYGGNKNVGLPMQSLMQALANTRMIDNFTVHITKSLAYTIRFLTIMTKRLACRYKDNILKGWSAPPEGDTLMTFKYFNKCSVKNKSLTVKDTFIKMLLQLKGVSVEKAVAITNQYKTPRSLINAYRLCDQKEGEMLLAIVKYGNFARNVGPTVSRTIYQLFSKAPK